MADNGERPIWTDAECNRFIVKFSLNAFILGACVGWLAAVLVTALAK